MPLFCHLYVSVIKSLQGSSCDKYNVLFRRGFVLICSFLGITIRMFGIGHLFGRDA